MPTLWLSRTEKPPIHTMHVEGEEFYLYFDSTKGAISPSWVASEYYTRFDAAS